MTQTDINVPVDGTITSAKLSGDLTLPGDLSFADNNKAIFGAGSDLQIYSDGDSSYLKENSATGSLFVDGDNIRFRTSDGSKSYALFTNSGSARLYHDNSIKIETTSTGIDVTGTATMDNAHVPSSGSYEVGGTASGTTAIGSLSNSAGKLTLDTDGTRSIHFKTGGNLRQFIDGSTGDISFYEDTGTTPKMVWSSSNETLAIGLSTANARLEVGAFATTSSDIAYFSNSNGSHKAIIRIDAQGDGEFVLRDAGNNEDVVISAGGDSYFTGGNVGIGTSIPQAALHVKDSGATQILVGTSDNSLTTDQVIGEFGIYKADPSGSGSAQVTASMKATSSNSIGAGSNLVFSTDGGAGATERMRIDSSGNVLVGTTSPSTTSNIYAAGSSSNAFAAGFDTASASSAAAAFSNPNSGAVARFYRAWAGAGVGSITVSGSATAYNTSSDRRLKENIADAPSASNDIDAIQVRSFDWKADGSHQKYGMVAQELLEVAPEAVSQGATEEDMMGVDYSKLVPMMIKEIQSLRREVEALKENN
jgi:hypothetical protein